VRRCEASRIGRAPAVDARAAKDYSEIIALFSIAMICRTAAVASLLLVLVVPLAASDARSKAREQVEFGIDVAQKGLWKEALYRWEKAVEIDPTYAAAFNDLAIAYEHEGLFDKARAAYETALKLDPNNTYIRQNLEFFKEINDRASRRTPR
jgi:Flp pilus assembly protein TadD